MLDQVAPLATGILAGDGGPIASYMLDGEAITFSGVSVHLQVAAGAQLGNGSCRAAGAVGRRPVAAAPALRPPRLSRRC
jgi:hypothetical protein